MSSRKEVMTLLRTSRRSIESSKSKEARREWQRLCVWRRRRHSTWGLRVKRGKGIRVMDTDVEARINEENPMEEETDQGLHQGDQGMMDTLLEGLGMVDINLSIEVEIHPGEDRV